MTVSAEYERFLAANATDASATRGLSETAAVPLGSLAYLAQLVGYAEHFAFSRALEVFDHEIGKLESPAASALYRQERPRLDSSWERVRTTLKDWAAIDLASLARWEELGGYVEVRNATLHGSGRLTSRQQRDIVNVAKKLSAASVSFRDSGMILPPNIVRRAALDCRTFVEALDARTRSLIDPLTGETY